MNSDYEMIYDEKKLKSIMSSPEFAELSKVYNYIQEMYPLKLKILKSIKCHNCGFCCTKCNAMLNQQDIELICRYLKCSKEEFYEKYISENAKMPYLKLPCPFLNKDKDCDVYPVRPKVCKEFPFNEFTVIVDPCLLGKDIRRIVEDIIGHPITNASKEYQDAAEESDKFFDHMIGENNIEDTGKHARINIDIEILKTIMEYLKQKKKDEKRGRR